MGKTGRTIDPSAVIIESEREMAEHAAELFDRTVEQMIGFVPAQATFAERCHVVEGLIEANPELHEAAERLAVLGVFLGSKDRRH